MRRLALVLLLGCAASKPAEVAAPPAPPAKDLNAIARADYAEARSRAIANAGPVMLVGPEHITLIDGKQREEMELAPPAYHQLKTIDHLALGLHSLYFEEPPPREKLLELREAALRAPQPEPKERQQRIIDLSLQVIDGGKDLEWYWHAVAPLLLENALDAARMEIADLDKATQRARQKLGARFDRMHVVIVGAHMAREGEIAQQYFEKLFGEREGLRIVFAEGLWDEAAQLQLLGTHILDASIGQGFFNDPRRMHRDLLSDAAAQVLSGR
jgi:hypothetical protein